MRILIDLQSAQESWIRGIGRWSLSAFRELIQLPEHECFLLVNTSIQDGYRLFVDELGPLIPSDRWIRFTPATPCASSDPNNRCRRIASREILRELVAAVRPDWVIYSGAFLTHVREGVLVPEDPRWRLASIAYDMIPYLFPERYLQCPVAIRCYVEAIRQLGACDLLLGISNSSSAETADVLSTGTDRGRTVFAAIDGAQFSAGQTNDPRDLPIKLDKPFVLYVSGADPRKNQEGLVRAFGRLSPEVMKAHILALAGEIGDSRCVELTALAASVGIPKTNLCFFRNINDSELVALYRSCRLFVFPSWHEGFGLPVLEAMHCDAPVIGANTSSVPEIIEWQDAMFDPFDEQSMAAKMERGLSDEVFREDLIANGRKQRARFSWAETARKMSAALRDHVTSPRDAAIKPGAGKPRLAFVTASVRSKTLAADLVPFLANHYNVDVITDCPGPVDFKLSAACIIRAPSWLGTNSSRVERIVYEWSEIGEDNWIEELMRLHPGVVVADEQKLGSSASNESASVRQLTDLWRQAGWCAVKAAIAREKIVKGGVLCEWLLRISRRVIVLGNSSLMQLSEETGLQDAVVRLDRPFRPVPMADRQIARRILGIPAEQIVCALMAQASHKGAMISTLTGHAALGDLLLLDGNPPPFTDANFESTSILTPSFTTEDQNLISSDLALVIFDGSETNSLDWVRRSLAANVPVLCCDFPDSLTLPEEILGRVIETSPNEIALLLQRWTGDKVLLYQCRQNLRNAALTQQPPREIVFQYLRTIEEAFAPDEQNRTHALSEIVHCIGGEVVDSTTALQIASALQQNFPTNPRARIVLDASVLSSADHGSGIQRVVGNLLRNCLDKPWPGLQTEVSAITQDGRIDVAVGFVLKTMGITEKDFPAFLPISLGPNDIFLGLDLTAHLDLRVNWAKSLQFAGKAYFVVYDILCIRHPEWFRVDVAANFRRWFDSIVEIADGLICISKAVADDVVSFLKDNCLPRKRQIPLKIGIFHLGADFVQGDQPPPRPRVQGHFLMVSTIEPRKGYEQALDAFEWLWKHGSNVTLNIVGRRGWNVDKLIKRIENHKEAGNRLHWFEGASDEMLTNLYQSAACVLVASEGEGFGLSLIEAAHHGTPLLCRDLPVFREVAGDHATYFSGLAPEELGTAILKWKESQTGGRVPATADIPYLDWAESAEELRRVVQDGVWYTEWSP